MGLGLHLILEVCTYIHCIVCFNRENFESKHFEDPTSKTLFLFKGKLHKHNKAVRYIVHKHFLL